MSKELSPELQAQIEQEADALSNKGSNNNDYENGIQHGLYSGYQDGATEYALLFQSEQEKRKEAEDALEKIVFEIQNAWEARLGGVITNQHATRLINVVTEYNNYKAKKDGTVNG